MSDYLGPNQTRVIDSSNRSFETVIYQRKKSPLSSEVNFTGNLAALHVQDSAKWVAPSGWDCVGEIRDGVPENTCRVGDVLASSTYPANSFKLMTLDRGILTKGLIAWVNGWKLFVQGTSLATEDNLITLPIPPSISYRVDFVFLEVWRKLVTPTDVIYTHGNVLYGGANYPNDLIDPAANIETTLRIQTQYRIRVVPAVDIISFPDGFDPYKVFVQGPLADPLDSCDQAFFSPVPGDPGLWRAGVGDTAAQEALQTVDGYTYAIPMFAVTRRSTQHYVASSSSNGAGRSLADYLAGFASDRPDNKYSDWIEASDILDMRHRTSPCENPVELCTSAFTKLIKGEAQNKIELSYQGEDHVGKTLVQVDGVSDNHTPTWMSYIGGLSTDLPNGIRRVWSNASVMQKMTLQVKTVNDKTVGTGGPWAAFDAVTISTTNYPAGTVLYCADGIVDVSINRAYLNSSPNYIPLTTAPSGPYNIIVTGSGTNTLTVQTQNGAIIGTTESFTLEYIIVFPSGSYGLTYLPDTMLEFQRTDSTVSIATRDMDIRVRDSSAVATNSGIKWNMLSNKGGEYSEPYNFGHQIIYHTIGNGSTQVFFDQKVNGCYNIIGVARALVAGVDKDPTISRDGSEYTLTFSTPVTSGTDVELWLYTETKFFDTNKQGRAIIDTMEMKQATPIEAADGGRTSFHFDASSQTVGPIWVPQPIIALASNASLNGVGYAFINGVQTKMKSWVDNIDLPTDTTKSRATIEFDSAPGAGAVIEVPFLMKSAVTDSEGYAIFYKRTPYQGILDSSYATGTVVASGPAITTTSGSGTITNYTYTTGLATFTSDSTIILGTGTVWTGNVKSGYLIMPASSNIEYIITDVVSDTELHILTKSQTSNPNNYYTITAKDKPSFGYPNVIDRLPALEANNDSTAMNGAISIAGSGNDPVLFTKAVSKVQDIVCLPTNSGLEIGIGAGDRGRYRTVMDEASGPLGKSNLGLKFEILDAAQNYQKTYQSYVLDKDDNGRLYMVVVGSETGNDSTARVLNHMANDDSVDIFEIPGRPLTNRAIK